MKVDRVDKVFSIITLIMDRHVPRRRICKCRRVGSNRSSKRSTNNNRKMPSHPGHFLKAVRDGTREKKLYVEERACKHAGNKDKLE